MRELQWCMAPLLALNRDEIVEAYSCNPWKENTEPPLCQRRKLLFWVISNLISNLMSKLTLKHPSSLCCWRYMSRHSLQSKPLLLLPLPSHPSPSGPLPSPMAKKPRSRTTGADTIEATQWVHSYLEDNYRVVEGILIPAPVSLWFHNPETGPSASHGLPNTCHTGREGWMMGHSTLPGGVG